MYQVMIDEKNFSYCVNESFVEYLRKCNFSKRLVNCQIKRLNKTTTAFNDFIFYVSDWNKLGTIIYNNFIFPHIYLFTLILIFSTALRSQSNQSYFIFKKV